MISKVESYSTKLADKTSVNYISHLPNDYDPKKKYPLLISMSGDGEKAWEGIDKLKKAGINKAIISNKLEVPMIVVSPQTPFTNYDTVGPKDEYKPGQFAVEMRDIAISRYSIDETRVYVTGLSMSGSSADLALAYYPDKFAAGINVSSWCPSYDEAPKIKGAIWHIKGNSDPKAGSPQGNIGFIEKIVSGGKAKEAKYTILALPGHDAWTVTYNNKLSDTAIDPTFKGSSKPPVDIYKWLLQFSTAPTVSAPVTPPVNPTPPKDPIVTPTPTPTPTTPITESKSKQMIITSNLSVIDSSKKQVFGTIQAENFSATNKKGTFTETNQDVDKGINIGWIAIGDYLDYNINVPFDGEYQIVLRMGTKEKTEVQIKSNNTTLATVPIEFTGGYQVWKDIKTTVNLKAGKQTLRIHASKKGWNFNHFTINPVSINVNGYTIKGTLNVIE